MEVPFVGGAYETFSKNVNAQECANFFVHVDQQSGEAQPSLRGTPGLKSWVDSGNYAPVRGLLRSGDYVYAVVGNEVYKIDSDKTSTQQTGTLETISGVVSMAANETQVMIVDGLSGYIVTGGAVAKISDTDFPNRPNTVTEQDGYFIVSVHNSGRGYISDLNDGTSWTGTQYFNAEGDPDRTLNILSDHRDVIMFGEETIEFWYNSGATVPFDRKPGYTQEVGLGARYSPAQIDNSVIFLTDDFQVARLTPSPKVVSTRAIEYQIAQDSDKANAVGMGITIEGNAFYILTTANNTWCYNAATGFWNKLASYPEPFDNRWRGNCYANLFGTHVIGDYQNGVLYEWDFDTFTDNGYAIRGIRTALPVKKENKNLFHHMLEVFFESGTGIETGQGSDPQAMLQYSDDGGHTWSSEIWRDIGQIGEYKNRSIWYRLGKSRERVYKLEISDPVKRVITGANLEVSVGIT